MLSDLANFPHWSWPPGRQRAARAIRRAHPAPRCPPTRNPTATDSWSDPRARFPLSFFLTGSSPSPRQLPRRLRPQTRRCRRIRKSHRRPPFSWQESSWRERRRSSVCSCWAPAQCPGNFSVRGSAADRSTPRSSGAVAHTSGDMCPDLKIQTSKFYGCNDGKKNQMNNQSQSINQSINKLLTNKSINQSINQSINRSFRSIANGSFGLTFDTDKRLGQTQWVTPSGLLYPPGQW